MHAQRAMQVWWVGIGKVDIAIVQSMDDNPYSRVGIEVIDGAGPGS